MSHHETISSVQTSLPDGQRRFRRWLVRRARQFSIVALLMLGFLTLGACGVMLRRATCLIGLPDVGDPFDVAAFRALGVPDDQNAFTLFQQAAGKLRPIPKLTEAVGQAGSKLTWEQTDPELRDWLESNREALGLFRQAALRPDGMVSPAGDPFRSSGMHANLARLVWLALLDTSRVEAQGDMTAAWDGYWAILRTRTLVMRRGTAIDRYAAHQYCDELRPRITTWAANPKTDVALIRRALSEIQSLEPKPEWDAHSLKLDYLQAMRMLDRPGGWVMLGANEDDFTFIGAAQLPPNLVGNVYNARRYLINEPERSRRVLRMAVANWLAYTQEKDPARRKPAVRSGIRIQKQMTYVSFFNPAPDAPAAARALSPHDLARWTTTTRDAKVLLYQWPWPTIRRSELREYGALVVALAEELYHRDHGSPPPSEQALVGTYLDRLPDDGSNDLDDGTAPIIDESNAFGTARPK